MQESQEPEGAWPKFSAPGPQLEREKKLTSIQLTPAQKEREVMKRLIDQLNDPTVNQQTQAAVRKQIADMRKREMERAVEADFAKDFRKWLQGQSKYNVVKFVDRKKNTRGDMIPVPRLCTPWGNKDLTKLPGVADFLDTGITGRAQTIQDLTTLRARGPSDINDAYIYYKYLVRGYGIDGDAVHECEDFSQYLFPAPVAYEEQADGSDPKPVADSRDLEGGPGPEEPDPPPEDKFVPWGETDRRASYLPKWTEAAAVEAELRVRAAVADNLPISHTDLNMIDVNTYRKARLDKIRDIIRKNPPGPERDALLNKFTQLDDVIDLDIWETDPEKQWVYNKPIKKEPVDVPRTRPRAGSMPNILKQQFPYPHQQEQLKKNAQQFGINQFAGTLVEDDDVAAGYETPEEDIEYHSESSSEEEKNEEPEPEPKKQVNEPEPIVVDEVVPLVADTLEKQVAQEQVSEIMKTLTDNVEQEIAVLSRAVLNGLLRSPKALKTVGSILQLQDIKHYVNKDNISRLLDNPHIAALAYAGFFDPTLDLKENDTTHRTQGFKERVGKLKSNYGTTLGEYKFQTGIRTGNPLMDLATKLSNEHLVKEGLYSDRLTEILHYVRVKGSTEAKIAVDIATSRSKKELQKHSDVVLKEDTIPTREEVANVANALIDHPESIDEVMIMQLAQIMGRGGKAIDLADKYITEEDFKKAYLNMIEDIYLPDSEFYRQLGLINTSNTRQAFLALERIRGLRKI